MDHPASPPADAEQRDPAREALHPASTREPPDPSGASGTAHEDLPQPQRDATT